MYDEAGVARAVRDLLVAVGEDPDRDGLADTPARVARSMREILAGVGADPSEPLATTFDLGHNEMVLVRDIRFYSLCEHHMLPFFGRASLAYVPADGRVTGLSKLARVVEGYARRLQVQERLTSQVADALVDRLHPMGVAVVIEAEHLCMTMRGVRAPGALTVTSALRGSMRSDERTRAEVMSLIAPAR